MLPGGTQGQSSVEQERPYLAAKSGKDERPEVPRKARPIEKVRQLQRKLYVCAKQSRTGRFHALYDRIYRSDVLREAWRRVRSNGGAAGVDAETAALKAGQHRPAPVKRRYIPKADGKQRPLGCIQ